MVEANKKSNPIGMLQSIKLPLWVSVLLVLLLIFGFFWKQAAVVDVEARMQEQSRLFEADKTALRAEAAAMLAQKSETAHRQLGTVLSWAIRSEMIRDNLDQIDQYFAELVKTENIKLAVLADTNGKLLVSSDKKFQDGEFSQVFPADLLAEAQVAIRDGQDGNKLLVIPVMGLNSRLGTAVVSYAP
ncbi:MAG: hypothetical protein AB1591_02715 [Pseudomonadota bacterium]